jgi:hypothetical protein
MAPANIFDAGPSDHLVLFYNSNAELIDRVGNYLLPAITGGGLAVAIATPVHRLALEDWLDRAGVDVVAARAGGHYLDPDAAETMRTFMMADCPSAAEFWAAISPLVAPAADGGRPVRAFGEMVSLLWDDDQVSAAIEVEAMWNELGSQYPFSLCCGYPARSVTSPHHRDALAQLYQLHTLAVGHPGEPG